MSRCASAMALASLVAAGDPSTGWLSYARLDTDSQAKITQMNMSWVVPANPTTRGASPALWFGIQTYKGDGALIQPILKWLSSDWYIFHEIYDWTDGHDEQPHKVKVQAGDHISAGLSYKESDNSYDMWMRSANLDLDLFYNYKLRSRQHAVEATGYIVLEHQPSSCGQLPSSDSITFENIEVAVEGAKLASPSWKALQERPKCNSEVVVQDAHTVTIKWNHQSAEQPSFEEWAAQYGMNEADAETRAKYEANVVEIAALNAADNGGVFGVNQFSGMSFDEFAARYLNANTSDLGGVPSLGEVEHLQIEAETVDWDVTPVKDQGECGSCWAFGTIGAIEAIHKQQSGSEAILSEQQLVDCSGQGCGGGAQEHAMDYLEGRDIYTASSYPYTATEGTCKTGVASGVQISGYKSTPKSDSGLVSALQSSAFTVSVEADSSWQHYSSGILTNPPVACWHNHAVTLTGATEDYFKIKNSWGLSWGEDGYIRFQRSTAGCGPYGIFTKGGVVPQLATASGQIQV